MTLDLFGNSSFLELDEFKQFGDCDYTAAFLRISDKAVEDGHGYNVLLPSGRIDISDTVYFNLSAGISYNDMGGINLTGPGASNCQLYWTKGDNSPMFDVLSSKIDAGPIVNLHWKGFSVGTSVPRKGIFFSGRYIGQSKFEDIVTFNLDQHYQLSDSLCVNFDKVQMTYGRTGLYAYRTDFTCPNSINFSNGGGVGGMSQWGIIVINGSALTIDGGFTVENNGLSTDPAITDKGGVKLVAPGVEGGVAASINNSYMEGNKGLADIYLTANPSYQSSLSVTNTIFNRKPSAALNHIRIDTDVGYRAVKLYHFANNFDYFDGDYVPDGSRKAIQVYGGGPVVINGDSRFRAAIEKPDVANDFPHASTVFSGTALSQRLSNNIASITRHAAGQYSFFFKIPSPGVHFVQAITNGGHVPQLYNEDASMVRVHFQNLSGVCTDPETARIRIFA
jgi:hypothetical protein